MPLLKFLHPDSTLFGGGVAGEFHFSLSFTSSVVGTLMITGSCRGHWEIQVVEDEHNCPLYKGESPQCGGSPCLSNRALSSVSSLSLLPPQRSVPLALAHLGVWLVRERHSHQGCGTHTVKEKTGLPQDVP